MQNQSFTTFYSQNESYSQYLTKLGKQQIQTHHPIFRGMNYQLPNQQRGRNEQGQRYSANQPRFEARLQYVQESEVRLQKNQLLKILQRERKINVSKQQEITELNKLLVQKDEKIILTSQKLEHALLRARTLESIKNKQIMNLNEEIQSSHQKVNNLNEQIKILHETSSQQVNSLNEEINKLYEKNKETIQLKENELKLLKMIADAEKDKRIQQHAAKIKQLKSENSQLRQQRNKLIFSVEQLIKKENQQRFLATSLEVIEQKGIAHEVEHANRPKRVGEWVFMKDQSNTKISLKKIPRHE